MAGMEPTGMIPPDATEQVVSIHCRSTPHPARVVRKRVARDRFVSSLREALQELQRALARAGEAAHELPFVAYHALTPDSVEIEIGIPQDEPTQVTGAERTSIPMGRYVSLSAPLDAAAVGEAYATLQRWLAQHAEHGAGPVYTTLALGAGPAEDRVLIQRRIRAGLELADDACVGSALLAPEAAELAVLGLTVLAREARSKDPPAPPRALDTLRSFARAARVTDVMSVDIVSCQRNESLAAAAQRMWEHDIGALPVLGADARPVGMITDRDICMAAYTQGRQLTEIPVGSVMSRALHTCHPEDGLSAAERQMATHQVRRLPVTDERGALVGMLSLNDVVLARTNNPLNAIVERVTGDVTSTLAEISRRRGDTRGRD